MAETLLSPGVLTRENDQSQVSSGPITVGAAIVGPTVKGPVQVPSLVTSYSDYKNKFGAAFISGGVTLEYLTSIAAYNYFQQGGESLLVTRVVSGSTAGYTPATSSRVPTLGGNAASSSFTLETLSDGVIMNNATQSGATAQLPGGALASGSANNIRWSVTNVNTGSGTFNLILRQGNDTQNQQLVVETWLNLSLDPNSPNYIEYVIGNQVKNLVSDVDGNLVLQTTGSYVNQSRYVRVSNVQNTTPNYLLNNGTPNPLYTNILPTVGSGSEGGAFGGATGPLFGNGSGASLGLKMFNDIDAVNIQGLSSSDYSQVVEVLSNPDEYDYSWVVLPGVTYQNGSGVLSTLMANCENRGDTMAIVDMVNYGAPVSSVDSAANSYDSSYGATYWPWVQVLSQETGKLVFVPASTVMCGVYAYNDKVAETWFAPAGFNRGGLSGVIQAERKLSPSDRDNLYINKVNPLATFPGQGVVAFGQKTLQSKASALDRVNVRRLLITLKRYIGNIADNLVFEQNTATTRNKFLNQVNPYLENVQQKQGLYAYKVVMDESNNTAETIDRNQLVGAIYLQPTKTAEFIILDFNITPTGVQFA
jgi:hypothetical protein